LPVASDKPGYRAAYGRVWIVFLPDRPPPPPPVPLTTAPCWARPDVLLVVAELF
jgi:hypothetical protein